MNALITGWHKTGNQVQIDQYEVHLELDWVDENGQSHHWEGDPKFPNVLDDMPARWVKDAMEQLIMTAVRHKLGDV